MKRIAGAGWLVLFVSFFFLAARRADRTIPPTWLLGLDCATVQVAIAPRLSGKGSDEKKQRKAKLKKEPTREERRRRDYHFLLVSIGDLLLFYF